MESFPPEKRGQAMAFWALGIVVAPMLGPVAGGWLTDNYSWRWVFYINVPIGVIALILTQLFIFDPPYLRKQRTGIDYWGIGILGGRNRQPAGDARYRARRMTGSARTSS